MSGKKWTKEHKDKLSKFWKESGKDRVKFKKLCMADKELSQRGWNACELAARPLDSYGDSTHQRAAISKEPPKVLEQIKKDLADPNLSWPELLKKYPQHTKKRLANFASDQGIKLNKKKTTNSAENREYKKRLSELVQNGILVKEGIDSILRILREEFPNSVNRLKKRLIIKEIEHIIWTKETERVLMDLFSHDTLDSFRQYFPHIPDSFVKKRVRIKRGVISTKQSATFIRGIGKLDIENEKPLYLPKYTRQRPFTIPLADGKNNIRIVLPNGAGVGLPYNPEIKKNKTRLALNYAEDNGVDCVILTNLIDVDVKKAAGPTKAFRAFFTSRDINPDRFDPNYIDEAKHIIATQPGDDQVYETTSEMFEDLLGGWWKIAHVPVDGHIDTESESIREKPQYNGPVFVVLGIIEERLATAAGYWIAAYNKIRKEKRLQALITAATQARKGAEKELDSAKVQKYEREIEKHQKQLARTRVTNVHPAEWKRFTRKALAYIVRRLEETIPNAKVIGIGTTYVQIKNRVIELNIPSHLRVTDSLLSERVESFGKDVLRGNPPDMVIICHPYALNFRGTAREVDAKGRRGIPTKIYTAPICADDNTIREKLSNVVYRSAHPIGKAVFNNQFASGVLQIEYTNDHVFDASLLSLSALNHTGDSSKKPKKVIHGKYRSLANGYIYGLVATDQHHGYANRERIWHSDTQEYLGVLETFFTLLRKAGYGAKNLPPLHFFSANDDPTQGEHFGTHKRAHVHRLEYAKIQEIWRNKMDEARRARNNEKLIQILAELQIISLHQIEVRGVHWVTHQLTELYSRNLRPYVDMYSGILRRAVKAKLDLRGVSHYISEHYPHVSADSRDAGFINWGTGNHFLKTTDAHLTEGGIYASQLRLLLEARPEWKDSRELLEKYVVGPLFGTRFIAWGTLQASGGYIWGLDFRDTVPKMQGWNDPLKGAIKNEAQRGNYSRIFEGKVTLRTYGDKHFFGVGFTGTSLHVMGPASTHTEEYGEWGFPPNNTGVAIVGLPANGPEAGPIIARPLFFAELERMVNKKEEVDWEAIFPNAL